MLSRQTQQDVAAAVQASSLITDYVKRHPLSAEHMQQAVTRLPGGITHDSRHIDPFNLSIARAEGAYKWDIEGNRYVDYVTGHGSLILGHNHPEVIEAVQNQLQLGTHLGGNSALELEWADRVCEIVPGAERVRFTSSGTEAVMLAIRLARNFTGRTHLIQFETHFHGWSDSAFGGQGSPGLPIALQSLATVVPCGDYEQIEERLTDETVAAVIIETSHPSFFTLEDPGAYLRFLREATEKASTLLIVDEVVSGFRWAPGGAQEFYGTHGDITSLAKILSGGLPCGAVAGRGDIIDTLSFDANARGGRAKIVHPGTFNANPLSASAGIACMDIVAKPETQQRATASASAIRTGMNAALRDAQAPGCVYGAASMFRIALGGEHLPAAEDMTGPIEGAPAGREATSGALATALNVGMMLEGVALFNSRGITSIAHSQEDIDLTVNAFAKTLALMQAESILT
ncbi:aminotransferase class III-fold pyridoxal phosphate-dependent enzyme [soil metagenome]